MSMTKAEAIECLEMFLHKQCDLGRMTAFVWSDNDVWDAVYLAYMSLKKETISHEEPEVIKSTNNTVAEEVDACHRLRKNWVAKARLCEVQILTCVICKRKL